MSEFRQPVSTTALTTAGGETALNSKRVFGYSLVTDGTNPATIEFWIGDIATGIKIWEDNIAGAELGRVVSFAEAPLGDPRQITNITARVTGTLVEAWVRNK